MKQSTEYWTRTDIQTVRNVEAFFSYLITNQKLNFHPDTPMADYVDADYEQYFSDKTAKRFDEIMEECFSVCKKNKVDIYSIGIALLQK